MTRGTAPQAEGTPLHPTVSCDRRKMDSEKEQQMGRLSGRQAENCPHMQRQSETNRRRDMETKRRTETNGRDRIVAHPSQHKGQLRRQRTFQKSLSLLGDP